MSSMTVSVGGAHNPSEKFFGSSNDSVAQLASLDEALHGQLANFIAKVQTDGERKRKANSSSSSSSALDIESFRSSNELPNEQVEVSSNGFEIKNVLMDVDLGKNINTLGGDCVSSLNYNDDGTLDVKGIQHEHGSLALEGDTVNGEDASQCTISSQGCRFPAQKDFSVSNKSRTGAADGKNTCDLSKENFSCRDGNTADVSGVDRRNVSITVTELKSDPAMSKSEACVVPSEESVVYIDKKDFPTPQGVANCPIQNNNDLPLEHQMEHSMHEVHAVQNTGDSINRNNRISVQADKENSGMTNGQNAVVATNNEFTLLDLLRGLEYLDANGLLSLPPQDNCATTKSQLSFSLMRDKINCKEYKTWKSFVDDFEMACQNVIHNEKRGTKAWDAACNLLHHGRKYLKENADKVEKYFSPLPKESDHTMALDSCCGAVPRQTFVDKSTKSGALFLEEDIKNTCGSMYNCAQNMVSIDVPEESKFPPEARHSLPNSSLQQEEPFVDILSLTAQDFRFDNSLEQASECSSSFGETDDDLDSCGSNIRCDDFSEAESEFWNQNVVTSLIGIDGNTTRERKKALRSEWKEYRRHIEWRCQWLELRYRELMSRASTYDRMSANIQCRKKQSEEHQIKAPSTRCSLIKEHPYRHRVLRRRPRRKLENAAELSSYLSRHPVYSIYEKRKRLETDGASVDDDCNSMKVMTGDLKDSKLNVNDSEDPLRGMDLKEGSSVEHLYCQIETLQSRVKRMQLQINKHYSGKAGIDEISKGLFQSIPSTETGTSKLRTPEMEGSSKLQRASSAPLSFNFDSSCANAVLPVNETSCLAEPAHYALENDNILDHHEREDSSDEVIADKACKEAVFTDSRDQLNAASEVSEHENRHITSSILTHDNSMKKSSTFAGENAFTNGCLPFEIFVPRRKRRKVHSRKSSQNLKLQCTRTEDQNHL
eukprot:TRINITY_DN2689_c0_g1_i4.p1 TRINITY_DN2689_c0_g1~~TRINITY_DN2689_c0_g1_i4.p1  ORF type:complete len:941 (+),score=225.04 TRINITY_DN2689_c0_g1_i4:63-2885(+)